MIQLCIDKGIDKDDAIAVLIYALENNLNPVEEIKKAFFLFVLFF